MLGASDPANGAEVSMTNRIGYKGTSTNDIRRRARWAAHMHGINPTKIVNSDLTIRGD